MSTKTPLSELLAQKAALERQIAETQRAEHDEAVAQVRALMSQYNLTMTDIQPRGGAGAGSGNASSRAARSKGSGGKVAVKFRDKATGDSWSGRGLKPKWLQAALSAGRQLEEFAV